MSNEVVRDGKPNSLIAFRDPSIPFEFVEIYPWEECFPQNTRYLRRLSPKDILFHESKTGGYGVFTPQGQLVACKGSWETAEEWVTTEELRPIYTH